MEPVFKTERAVSESLLRLTVNCLPQECTGIPANFQVASGRKFEKACKIVLPFPLQSHDVVVAVFDFEHTVLRYVRRIGYGRTVGIGDDSAGRLAGALRCAACAE